MKLTKERFGTFESNDVTLFTLINDSGMKVKIMDYGATITSIQVPVEDGEPLQIVCGFDTFESYFSEEYKNNAPYFGCTVGRYCSQIKNSKFSLNGKEYALADNCGDNNLHGGQVGFDKKMWCGIPVEKADAVGVEFTLHSKSMEEGFPGDVDVKVTFLLTNDNEIKIDYWGKPTEDTPLSMTNHSYFNLTGFKKNILGHAVNVNADKFQVCDDTGAATGEILAVDGTVHDLRKPLAIKEAQDVKGGGFETFYITETDFQIKKLAEVVSPENKLKLEVSSNEPCMLFYTGIYTSDKLNRESGEQFGQFRGFCFETHRFQNGPNIEGSPKTITNAGEEFKSQTIFKLTW